MTLNLNTVESSVAVVSDTPFHVSRPHSFGLVVHGPVDRRSKQDYLHDVLLADRYRNEFWSLVEAEGLVVCKNVETSHATYRRVRGKSSKVKLSQAEYYHHDGCSCPTKPRVVEIRMPHQAVDRTVPTAVAPFSNVMQAMLAALPKALTINGEIELMKAVFAESREAWPPVEKWDAVQGKVTRLVRKELDADACRAYFREVDRLAGSYVLPWEMGESRLMLNNHANLSRTMQHRRSYQPAEKTAAQNGSLVKRWPAEELENQ